MNQLIDLGITHKIKFRDRLNRNVIKSFFAKVPAATVIYSTTYTLTQDLLPITVAHKTPYTIKITLRRRL